MNEIFNWVQQEIDSIGYLGIAVLIALESFVIIMPSELILALAGSLSARGRFSLPLLILAATMGSLFSSMVIYSVARFGGEPLIARFLARWGKWVLLSPEDLAQTRAWFARRGDVMVIVGRVTPGLRTMISVPAGLARMPPLKFALFTAIGSACWNGCIIMTGWILGENWSAVEGILAPVGPLVYLALLAATMIFFWRRWRVRGQR